MIPGLPSIGGGEILILLAIVLLFFGAKRIPELARSLGKGTREFRKGIAGADEEQVQEEEDRKHKAEKEPSLEGEAREEKPRAEEESAPRAKPKTP